jgi:hypothetical protein
VDAVGGFWEVGLPATQSGTRPSRRSRCSPYRTSTINSRRRRLWFGLWRVCTTGSGPKTKQLQRRRDAPELDALPGCISIHRRDVQAGRGEGGRAPVYPAGAILAPGAARSPRLAFPPDRAAALVAGMVQGAPAPPLQALINSVTAGHGLHLYIPN